MFTFYLSTLGIVPYFTLRTFLPLFMTALVARFGPGWGLVADLAGIQLLSEIPVALTGDFVLLVLGTLALAEVGALKNPELREFLTVFDSKIKATAASALPSAASTRAATPVAPSLLVALASSKPTSPHCAPVCPRPWRSSW